MRIDALIKHDFRREARRHVHRKIRNDPARTFRPDINPLFRRDIRRHQNRSAPVLIGRACRRLLQSLLDARHIGQPQRTAILALQHRHLTDPRNVGELALHLNANRAAFGAQAPRRVLGIRRQHGACRLAERQTGGRKRLRVHHDPHFLNRHPIGLRQFRGVQPLEPVLKVQRQPPHDRQGRLALPGPCQRDDHGGGAHILPRHFRL